MNLIDRYCDALEAEAKAEKRAQREASKLEPLTFVIADQEELKRIYALAARQRWKEKPVSMIRRHLRGWSREELEKARAEAAA